MAEGDPCELTPALDAAIARSAAGLPALEDEHVQEVVTSIEKTHAAIKASQRAMERYNRSLDDVLYREGILREHWERYAQEWQESALRRFNEAEYTSGYLGKGATHGFESKDDQWPFDERKARAMGPYYRRLMTALSQGGHYSDDGKKTSIVILKDMGLLP